MCEALSQQLGADFTMIQTMFLCAGLGKRLLPLTHELPKPMVPLGDRTLLVHLLDELRTAGGRLCAVNTHHLHQKIAEFIRDYDPRIHVSHEVELLGTAGGVKAAWRAFDRTPLVVWNADILTQPNLEELVAGLALAPLALAVEKLPVGQGNVGLDSTGRVVRLRQQSFDAEVAGGNYIGILAMRPDAIELLPQRGCLIGDVAIPLLQRGGSVVGIAHRPRWTDLGSLQAYLGENIFWLERRSPADGWIHPSAKVAARVELKHSIVGRGATVRGAGPMDRVVVWPGASCEAPLSDAIVTPEQGVVSVPTFAF